MGMVPWLHALVSHVITVRRVHVRIVSEWVLRQHLASNATARHTKPGLVVIFFDNQLFFITTANTYIHVFANFCSSLVLVRVVRKSSVRLCIRLKDFYLRKRRCALDCRMSVSLMDIMYVCMYGYMYVYSSMYVCLSVCMYVCV